MKTKLFTLLALGALTTTGGTALAQSAPQGELPQAPAVDPATDPALLPDPAAPQLSFKIRGVNAEDEDGEGAEGGEGHEGGGEDRG